MSARLSALLRDNRRAEEANARVRRIMAVAQRMFVERGYERTSLDAILKRSGGSKATLRKYFGNKAGLLAALLETRAGERVTVAEQAVTSTGDPEAALRAFGAVVLNFYLQPDALIVYRSVIAEGYRNPELARGLYEGGHRRIVTALATHLRRWHSARLVHCPDPEGDAERFIGLLRSGPHERGLLGLQKRFTPAAVRAHLSAALRLFLGGIDRRHRS